MDGLWKAVIDLCEKQNNQIFSTTHSYECIDSSFCKCTTSSTESCVACAICSIVKSEKKLNLQSFVLFSEYSVSVCHNFFTGNTSPLVFFCYYKYNLRQIYYAPRL